MSESVQALGDSANDEVGGRVTAGGLLKAARQAQGLHIATLASMLKVPARKLEALEGDQYGDLQGVTYVRALAQATCRALKLDPAPVLAKLPLPDQDGLGQVRGGLNAPFRERGMKREPSDQRVTHVGMWGLVSVLVLAAVAMWWLPRDGVQQLRAWLGIGTVTVADGGAAAEPLPVEALPPAASGPAMALPGVAVATASNASATAVTSTVVQTVAQSEVQLAASLPSPAPPRPQPLPSPSPQAAAALPQAPLPVPAAKAASAAIAVTAGNAAATTAPAASPAAVVTAGDASAASGPGAPAAPLQFHAREASWVEVVDAGGKLLLGRTLASGETLGVSGASPFRVKIGNVRGTDLMLRGQVVELSSLARDNVVRLELK